MTDQTRQSSNRDAGVAGSGDLVFGEAELFAAQQAYVISLAITQDPDLARSIALKTITRLHQKSKIIKTSRYNPQVAAVALKLSRRQPQEQPKESPLPEHAAVLPLSDQATLLSTVDQHLWSVLGCLEWRERLICVAVYVLDATTNELARLLHVSPKAVAAQMAIFENRLRTDLAESSTQMQTEPLILAAESIRRLYAPPAWTPEALTDLLAQSSKQRQPSSALQQKKVLSALLISIIALSAIAICLVLIGFTSFYLFQRSVISNIPPSASTSTVIIIPTTQPKVRALTWLSDSDTVRKRIQESVSLWKTIYLDVQIIDYGPVSYLGAPRIYRGQVWVDQPSQSIQLFGLLASSPSSAYLYTNGQGTYSNPVLQESYTKEFSLTGSTSVSQPTAIIENPRLRPMVYPREAYWASVEGTFRMVDSLSFLNRSVIVVDWFDRYGQRHERIWLDAYLGIVLKRQEYGGENYDILISESEVTELAVDQNFPPTSLTTALRQVGSSSPLLPADHSIVIQPTLTPAVPLDRRAALNANPAPTGFDPRPSQLLFQFPFNLGITNILNNTAQVPAQIFADSYGLGTTEFGLPWVLRCARSPDGYYLAFNTGSDGVSLPDDELRWLDLRKPQEVFKLLPGMHVDAFAFSPDSAQIAVFARGSTEDQDGIFLVKVATGENRSVTPLYSGHSLVWSPDGEMLALVGRVFENERDQVLLVHVPTGQIVFQKMLPPGSSSIPQDWPMSNWGVPFPPPVENAMDVCAAAP